ncbi:AraC-like DNA-binding protein [Chitinophaga japonensis]|uniref:AraC-like DNA-binding protein n=2 Tax=Chitinophaga japonensis TaxID=104662 RepID=A0A562SUU4_CHIJA|nr:AraC-like DNA-binding protein [Chitinophaga japonensis]
MSKDTARLDINGSIRYFLSTAGQAPQSFGIDKYGELPPSHDFAILSNEGGVKSSQPIRTDHFALILCIRGHCSKTVGPHTFQVIPQSIHIVSPRDLHSFENASDDLLLYMILFRDAFIANTFIKEHILDALLELPSEHPPVYHLDDNEFKVIRGLFKKIAQEYQRAHLFYLQVVRLLVVELLFEVNRSHERALQQTVGRTGRKFQLVAAFKKLVEEHFHTVRTVQQYADMLHVSANHLGEQVKEETGENALTIIHKRIFLEAQYLLRTSSCSIKEIAEQLSFDTSSHFSRFFKHFAGLSPSAYKADNK